jgi:hypothetical protein
MPKVFTKEEMPVKNEHIPKQQEIKKWSHLTGIDQPGSQRHRRVHLTLRSRMSVEMILSTKYYK